MNMNTKMAALVMITLINTACFSQSSKNTDSLRTVIRQLEPEVTKKDMVIIKVNEMPINLKQVLQATQYRGWESGTIYRTKLNDMFLIEFRQGNSFRSFRFDPNGKQLDP